MLSIKLAGVLGMFTLLSAAIVEDVMERVSLGMAAFIMLFYFAKELFNKVLVPWTRSSIETQKSIQQTQAAITRNQEQIVVAITKVTLGLEVQQKAHLDYQHVVERHMAADQRSDSAIIALLEDLTNRLPTHSGDSQ